MKTLQEMIITATLTGRTYISGDICYNSNKGFHWRYSKEPFNGEADYLGTTGKNTTQTRILILDIR